MLTTHAIPQMVPPETVESPTTPGSSPTRSISRRLPRWNAAARYPPPESDRARLPSGRRGSNGGGAGAASALGGVMDAVAVDAGAVDAGAVDAADGAGMSDMAGLR